jgi:long-chain acyl-CoA synthetase
MSYIKEARSLGDLIRLTCEQNAKRTAVLYAEKGQFKPVNYEEFFRRIYRFAAVLHSLGLRRGDRLALASENCLEWALTDWAAQTLGIVLVPIYPTLPPEQAQYIVRDCGARVFIGSTAEQAQKVAALEDLKVVLFKPAKGWESMQEIAESATLDYEKWLEGIRQTDSSEVATIIYTSGTTGKPKGVMLQHKSFLFICQAIKEAFGFGRDEVFLSFLPLSHVYERVAGHVLPMALGATIGYAQSIATLTHDMLAVRPTVMLCVPRFLESLRHKILDSVLKQSPLHRQLFYLALKQGSLRSEGKWTPLAGVLDWLVGRKIRARTGGRLRYFVSGGAALSKHVSDFYMALGFTVIQGYGLTETSAVVTVNLPHRNRPDTVGEPLPGVQVKIAEDGEILVKSGGVMQGYYNLPQATAEAIDVESWFHTGDIGKFENSHLKITDRKKDLIVLGNGKNVAPQPIENRLKESSLIEEAVLFGDGMEYVCALVVPRFENLTRVLEERETAVSEDKTVLVSLKEVREIYRAEIEKVNRELADFEKVKKFELLDHSFSISDGELTPSMKVRRAIVKERYADLIRRMQRNHKEELTF